MAKFILRGTSYDLDKEIILRKTKGLVPGPIRKYDIELHRQYYPIKQVISHTTGLSVADFTAHDAFRILKKLGFKINIERL
jgi:hypothetical protein